MKYVYKRARKTNPWYAQVYDRTTKELRTIGTYATSQEAHYAQLLADKGHHWQGMPEKIPGTVFGFIYSMTHKESGRQYIGAKQLFFWNGPQGGFKCSNPVDPEFDKTLWHESDWREYASSSKKLSVIVDAEGKEAFDYEIISLHTDKLDLFMSELLLQVELNVLDETDSNGEYVYYNENIMGQAYRPVVPIAKLRVIREDTAAKARDYYLRPNVCEGCGEVIPFGENQCPKKPLFGNGDCNAKRKRTANG